MARVRDASRREVLEAGLEIASKVHLASGKFQQALLDSATQAFLSLIEDPGCPAQTNHKARFALTRLVLDYSDDWEYARKLLGIQVEEFTEEWVHLKYLELDLALRSDQPFVVPELSPIQRAEFDLLWLRKKGTISTEAVERLRDASLGPLLDLEGANGVLANQWRTLGDGKLPAKKEIGQLASTTTFATGNDTFELHWPNAHVLEHAKCVLEALVAYETSDTPESEVAQAMNQLHEIQLSSEPVLLFYSVYLFHNFKMYSMRDIAYDKLRQICGGDPLYYYCVALVDHASGDIAAADAAYKRAAEAPDLSAHANMARNTIRLAQGLDMVNGTSVEEATLNGLLGKKVELNLPQSMATFNKIVIALQDTKKSPEERIGLVREAHEKLGPDWHELTTHVLQVISE